MKFHNVKLSILLFPMTFSVIASDNSCIPRSYGLNSIVCVCNATYCDTISPIESLPSTEYVVITSNEAGLRFNKSVRSFTKPSGSPGITLTINTHDYYQTIIGWGGALTDAAGININALSDGAKENILKSYFSNEGIEYNLVRVPMGGSDFSTHPYSYHDDMPDKQLKNFKLAPEDYEYKIPLLRQAGNISKGNLWLYSSTWIAPKWMKTNNQYYGIGYLKDSMYQAWADYFLKFLRMYKREGLEFWGITTGNEPSLSLRRTPLPTVGWWPDDMGTWIANNLGPTLRNSEFSSIKILGVDGQRILLPWHIEMTLSCSISRNYVDGIAVHWYYDSIFPPTLLTETHNRFPNKFILYTEAAMAPVALGNWNYAEIYAGNIIENLQHWVAGWTDWSIVVDMMGGPTYTENYHDAPIIVNAADDEFYKQPTFYTMGHFSKFIPRGSVKIGLSEQESELDIIALRRPDNGTVVVILNRNPTDQSITVTDNVRGNIELVVGARSINTVLYW